MSDDRAPDFESQEPPLPRRDAAVGVWIFELRQAAKEEAQRALEAHAAVGMGADRQSVIAAGLSSEYLLVALILTVDPLLLADRRHTASAIMLSRHNVDGFIDHRQLRTISVTDCIDLLGRMFPELRINVDATALAALRNTAAHTAHVETDDPARALQYLVRVSDALLPLIPVPSRLRFWPSGYESAIAAFREQAANMTRQIVETRLAFARERLESLLFALEPSEIESVLRPLERRGQALASTQRNFTCPACHRMGVLDYSARVVVNGDARDESIEVTREEIPTDFYCTVCELELGGDMIDSFPEMAEHIEVALDDGDRAYAEDEALDWLQLHDYDVDARETNYGHDDDVSGRD